MKKIILLAIFLRVLVAIFYFHQDIKTYYFQTSFLKNGVFNVYKYLIQNRESLPLKEEFVYFPLTHLVLGTYQTLISPFVNPEFDSWLKDASSTTVVKNPNVFWFLFIMKFPYLVLDIAIGLFLLKISKKAFYIWLFNPFTIILFYVFSNVDIMPIFCTVVSFFLAKQKKYLLASVLLGVGAAFKVYPFLLLPFLFLKGKGIKEKALILFLPLLTFAFFVTPFWSQEFIKSALVSGLTTRIVNVQFVIFYSLIFFYLAFFRKNFSLLTPWILVFLVTFSFAHFHIQWLTWVSPFLVILISETKKYNLILLVLILFSFLIPLLYEDRSMSWSLLRIYSTYYDLLPTPYMIVGRFINPLTLQKLSQLIFALMSVVFTYRIFKDKESYE